MYAFQPKHPPSKPHTNTINAPSTAAALRLRGPRDHRRRRALEWEEGNAVREALVGVDDPVAGEAGDDGPVPGYSL